MAAGLLLVTFSSLAKAVEQPCLTGWEELALTPENWDVMWDGEGRVSFENGVLKLKPKSSTEPTETHSALVVSKKSFLHFTTEITYVNEAPLRQNSPPKPWELFWVFFNYQKDDPKRPTNYFIAKTIGPELGKAFEEIRQTFFWTGDVLRAGFGNENRLILQRTKSNFTASNAWWSWFWRPIDAGWVEKEGPLGLYTEDAEVTVKRVCIIPYK